MDWLGGTGGAGKAVGDAVETGASVGVGADTARPVRAADAGIMRRVRYRVRYTEAAIDCLRRLTARQQQIVTDAADDQLAHEPTEETRNRHPMRAGGPAAWELRIGNLRVYYDVSEEPEGLVTINLVALKLRNRVIVPGLGEVEL